MTETPQFLAIRSAASLAMWGLLCAMISFSIGCQSTRKHITTFDQTAAPPTAAARPPRANDRTAVSSTAQNYGQSRSAPQKTLDRNSINAHEFATTHAAGHDVSNNRHATFLQGDQGQKTSRANTSNGLPSAEVTSNLPPAISIAPDPTDRNSRQLPGSIANSPLSLDQVLESVESYLPQIEMAIQQIEAADGKFLASMGKFDTMLSGHSLAQPLGFYETYRNQLGVNQPLWNGGEVYGTYRMGDGNFEPWYGERETNEGGELKAGFSIPLLKNIDIDERRADVLGAAAVRTQNQAGLGIEILNAHRMAAAAYWNWVASGQALKFRKQILELAEERVSKIELRVEMGDLAKLVRLDNQRFIAKRTSDVYKARRKLQASAIKLSIYYRDENGQPIIVDQSQLPELLPVPTELSESVIQEGIATGTTGRPEIRELDAVRQQYEIELRYAENLLLPKLDFKGFAGQDLGGLTSKKGDKQPLEIQAGVVAELPWQRREGQGKSKAARAKLAQLNAKRQLTSDKIRAEITDAASAINNAADRYDQATKTLRLTNEALALGKIAFEGGDIDLIQLNIYETAVANAKFDVLDSELEFAVFQVVYRTAISTGQF